MMKLMDKHKNIINLLGVCTQDGEGAVQAGLGQGAGLEWEKGMGLLGTVAGGTLGWDRAGQGLSGVDTLHRAAVRDRGVCCKGQPA